MNSVIIIFKFLAADSPHYCQQLGEFLLPL